jgi:hypothetical protein
LSGLPDPDPTRSVNTEFTAKTKEAEMFMPGRKRMIGIVIGIVALAVFAGKVSPASANTMGGDEGKHYVISTCTTNHISVMVNAAGSFNGQQVATKIWARPRGGTWGAVGGWHYTNVYPIQTFDDGFGSPISSVTPKTLYTAQLSTDGGYREIGVEYYWLVNGIWTGYDFFVENTYNQGSPIGFLTTGTCVT